MLIALAGITLLGSCQDDETYAEQKEKERKAINAFLERSPMLLLNSEGDTLFFSKKPIKVISEEQFVAQDTTTNVEENEFVLFSGSGIYMQVVRKGVGQKLGEGESKRLSCRYYEYNIVGDSLQTTNKSLFWSTTPEILDVSNNYGTITASFNTSLNGGGAMYRRYSSITVPSGWLLPLSYVRIGRQEKKGEGIALVRLILPHTEGHSEATTAVYPCFYEISYTSLHD